MNNRRGLRCEPTRRGGRLMLCVCVRPRETFTSPLPPPLLLRLLMRLYLRLRGTVVSCFLRDVFFLQPVLMDAPCSYAARLATRAAPNTSSPSPSPFISPLVPILFSRIPKTCHSIRPEPKPEPNGDRRHLSLTRFGAKFVLHCYLSHAACIEQVSIIVNDSGSLK